MHLIPLNLLKVGFTIVENNLSKHLEDDLVAMPRHTSFSTGASAHHSSMYQYACYDHDHVVCG